jgi:hypothetical protein
MSTIFDNPSDTCDLVVHVLLAFSEKSKPLSDEKFIEACEAISASFLNMANDCRSGELGKP